MKRNRFVCENPKCGKFHDGSYGSGRFCSEHCRRVFIGITSSHNGNHKCNFPKKPTAPHGTWRCEECNLIFSTKREKTKHNRIVHGFGNAGPHNRGGKPWNKDKTKRNDKRVEQYGSTLSNKYKAGILIPHMKGKHHDEKTKRKMRISTLKYIEKTKGTTKVRYNKRSIKIIDDISRKHGWNLQHAENGGEFYVDGYWIDAYDWDRNIVLEYDERRHYTDIKNNILIERDIYRQNYIIEKLQCKFYRYNESTGVLWCVNP